MNFTEQVQPRLNVLRMGGVERKTGLSRANLYNKLNPRSKYYDETFPQQIQLGIGSVGWLESEIDTWILNREKASEKAKVLIKSQQAKRLSKLED